MAMVSDKLHNILNASVNSREYRLLRKDLNEDEVLLLKKLLRQRSDAKYKLKRKDSKIQDCFTVDDNVDDNVDDLNINVKEIRVLLNELVKFLKNKSRNVIATTESTSLGGITRSTQNESDLIESYITVNNI